MKLRRRILLLALSACSLAYFADLGCGICQIAAETPPGQESSTWAGPAPSSLVRDFWRNSIDRLALFGSSPPPGPAGESTLPLSSPLPSKSKVEDSIEAVWEQLNKPALQRARKFRSYVERHSETFQISRCLLYAVIQVESSFNVQAASPASAYGLMQLVPESGGRAAYRLVYGSDEIPSREFLEDPDKNIELGAAYLKLAGDFFAGVEDHVSREYCQIAAYNTGAGNVLKVFGGGYSQAIATINSLSPADVYEQLTTNLPYQETRSYLPKVLAYRRQFASL